MNLSSIFLAALLSSSSHRVHTIEGVYPTVTLGYGVATISLSYPIVDGEGPDTYIASYPVVIDPALRKVLADGRGPAHGRVRIARADGERMWHVVAFVPDSAAK